MSTCIWWKTSIGNSDRHFDTVQHESCHVEYEKRKNTGRCVYCGKQLVEQNTKYRSPKHDDCSSVNILEYPYQ